MWIRNKDSLCLRLNIWFLLWFVFVEWNIKFSKCVDFEEFSRLFPSEVKITLRKYLWLLLVNYKLKLSHSIDSNSKQKWRNVGKYEMNSLSGLLQYWLSLIWSCLIIERFTAIAKSADVRRNRIDKKNLGFVEASIVARALLNVNTATAIGIFSLLIFGTDDWLSLNLKVNNL